MAGAGSQCLQPSGGADLTLLVKMITIRILTIITMIKGPDNPTRVFYLFAKSV